MAMLILLPLEHINLFSIPLRPFCSQDLSFSSHSAVIANFGKEFAKTGILNPKFHHYLMESQDRRNIGDYSVLAEVTKEEVREMLAWAKEFIKVAENYLKRAF